MNFFKRLGGIFKNYGVFWALLVVGIVVGSFCDLQISSALAQPGNYFANFMESAGEMLGYAVIPFGMALATAGVIRKPNAIWKKALAIVLTIVVVMGTAYFSSANVSGQSGYSFKFDKTIGFVISAVVCTVVYFVAFFLVDQKADRGQIVVGTSIVVTAILVLVLVNYVFKGLVYRPRFRALAWDNTINNTTALGFEYYRPWWNFSFWVKPYWFADSGISAYSDYIKSWPSGHTACATLLIMFPWMLHHMKGFFKNTKRSKVLSIVVKSVVYAYIALVAFARVLQGAHFLSDVCFGALISSVLCLALSSLVMRIAFLIGRKAK